MVYGTKYYGVMEANYSICLVHLLTAWLGPGMWRMRVPLPLPGLLGTDASEQEQSLARPLCAPIGACWCTLCCSVPTFHHLRRTD